MIDIRRMGFPGMVIAWPFRKPPEGWLLCNGMEISRRSRLGRLFVNDGCLWGDGDGYKTVNIPDFRGRVLMMTTCGIGGEPLLVGDYGGKRECILSKEQLPPHSHTFVGPSVLQGIGEGTSRSVPMGTIPQQTTRAGKGQPVSLMQPYGVVSIIIRL